MPALVTIKTSNVVGELAVAKSFLESNGIYCFLKDELTYQVHPFAIGGVKLQVREDEAQRAVDLLIEGGFVRKEDFEIPPSSKMIMKLYERIKKLFGGK
ncbi:DUF2007 domain-containing protein [Dysgonomonas sp. 511]|uniref:putative signal transducing protein n=1 Tax=Dysgonomonas sp. 511 TaxID=2302930 RepID=UPI0013D45591|nr:DUF2007 domain-containing protein [Dysgonomonas sp. 511]NDV79623.1 hypothetical protein [Dysgonomonas sp. 511]